MIKKRILIANDASFLQTGYGIYGKELLTRLHNSGRYEIAELGCYAPTNHPAQKDIPWKFYPNAVNGQDERFSEYQSNKYNQFGAWRFNRVLLEFKPHIVFDVRDYWMSAYQEISPFRSYYTWILMPTVDSAPPKREWLHTFAAADIIVPYTEWAKTILTKECGSNINLFPKIVNAGINKEEFYPVEDKKSHQMKYFGKEVAITGVVMRNQRRKIFDDLMIAFKGYLNHLLETNNIELYNKSYLYLHSSYPEESGWDFPALLLENGLFDKTYFSYICHTCKGWFPAKFKHTAIMCPSCKTKSVYMSSPNVGVKTAQLNDIYNLFDIYLQYSICEGFGMPQIEAAACGLQIASVDYSAMSEIVENLDGIKVPVKTMFRELESNANRALPDNQAAADILFNFFTQVSAETKANNSIQIRHKCLEYYSWDKTYEIWDECFQTVDIKNKISWDTPMRPTNHDNIKVPPNLQPKEFVRYICQSILNEPDLAETAVGQNIVSQLLCGLSARDGMIKHYSQNDALKTFELLLNSKLTYGHLKEHPEFLVSEDFI